MTLQDPSGKDGGPYKCHVKNEHGESNAKLNLNIETEQEVGGAAPSFVEKPRIESSSDGKTVTMQCKVKADPKPSVVWYKESTIIKESSRISIKITQVDTYAIMLQLKVISLLNLLYSSLIISNVNRILNRAMPANTNAS